MADSQHNRLLEQIRAWRDQLINLTRRNRLLYFKPTRASTLILEDPDLEEILRRLEDDRRSGWGFFGPPTPEEHTTEEQEARSTGHGDGERPEDEVLTQFADLSSLQRALRNLARRSSQEYLDKGIWILYLGVGMLLWKDEEVEVRSPLVLRPVMITRETPRSPYRLVAMDEDVVVNPSLASKMEADFGLTLPELEDAGPAEILDLLSKVRTRARRKDMDVLKECVVSIFSFHKEVMYRDLKDNEAAIAEHDVVQALAFGHESDGALGFDPLPEDQIDEECPPEVAFAILDADASQQQCLAAAADGKSFVMDGPPGTGKSQTIANIIAGALHRGASVLFVSEKAAALEVVASRLGQVGLGEFILELHSHKARRKEFAAGLAQSLTVRPIPPSRVSRQRLVKLAALRRELDDYAAAMNEVREPLGMSLHEVLGRVTGLQHLSAAPVSGDAAATLSAHRLSSVLSSAADLARSWGPIERGEDFLWRDCAVDAADQTTLREIASMLDLAREALLALRAEAADSSKLLGFPIPRDAAAVEPLLRSVELMSEPPSYWTSAWLLEGKSEQACARSERLSGASERHAKVSELLGESLGQSWKDLDPGLPERLGKALVEIGKLEPPLTLMPNQDAASLGGLTESARAGVTRIGDAWSSLTELLDGLGVQDQAPSVRAIGEIADLGTMIGLRPQPDGHWLDSIELPRARESAAVLMERVGEFRAHESRLADTFSQRILAVDDLRDLVARFAQQHRGLRKLLPAYRADKRTVALASRGGRASKEVLARLPEAIRWQEARDELRKAEGLHQARLGEYYRGIGTDFAAVQSALDNAEAVLRSKPSLVSLERVVQEFSLQGRPDSRLKEAAEDVAAMLRLLTEVLPTDYFDQAWRDLALSDLKPWLERVTGHIENVRGMLETVRATTGADLSVGQAEDAFALVIEVARLERSFQTTASSDRTLLGPGYDLWRTDWGEMIAGAKWAMELEQVSPAPLTEAVTELVADGLVDSGPLASCLDIWRRRRIDVESWFEDPQRARIRDLICGGFDEVEALLRDLADSIDDVDEWVAFRESREDLVEFALGPVIQYCEQQRLSRGEVPDAVERSVLEGWSESVIASDARIKKLRRTQRDSLVEEFREIDREVGRHAVAEIIRACNQRRPRQALGGAGLIRAEGLKKRRHRPIRRLIAEARDVIQTLKPCFMMSPLSVSQFLDPDTRFDLVIFDEASQVQPSDAINCIYRGRQIVIAGDQKQLPPTSFFMGSSGMDDADEWSEDQLDEFESVLDVAKAGGMRSLPLRWHYRSRNEGLITFSNYAFYDGALVTYPSPDEVLESVGVELYHVDGVYRRGGSRDNPVEADKVVERVLHHARAHPNRTLGVVAFSEAQASLIEYALEQRRREYPDLDGFFEGDRLSGFFVKNLENVQGDERDTMIFSIGYGPDEFGRFTLNFGPLNRPGGERRLNVAVTRARERVEVVSSVRGSDFGSGSTSVGVRFLARYLDYAERGIAALSVEIGESGLDAESPFEEEVIRVIRSWGFGVQPQVGAAGYRIDIGVKEADATSRFVLGVECDGAQYHSSRVARDRDRLRQGVLENLGWRIYRIWGPAWYRTRAKEEEALRAAIDAAISGAGGATGRSNRFAAPPPSVSTKDVDLDGHPEWASEYVLARPRLREGLDLGARESLPQIVTALGRIVEVETPISYETALVRLKEAGGVARAGRRIRETFDEAVKALKRQGRIRVDARRFIWWAKSNQVQLVRTPIEDDPATVRKVSDVPPEEMRLAVLNLLTDAITAGRDELTFRTARLFGWTRRGSDIGRALDQAVTTLVREGLVAMEGDLLRVVTEH